jgi:hypothetical protein
VQEVEIMTAFLATMMALGGIAAFESLMHGVWAPSSELLLLVVLACVTAPHSLDLGHNARISILHPYVMAAIVLLGTSEAVIVAGVSMVYFWIVSRPRLATVKAIFNLCNYLIAAWLAGHVFYGSGGRLGDVGSSASLAALLYAILTFFIVSTALFSVSVALERRLNPFRVWYEKYSWTLNGHLVGGSLVILVGMLRERLGAQVLFLTLPFCILLYHFYRAFYVRASHRAHRT